MPSPLSNDQKRVLILQHLRPAFEAWGARQRAFIDTPAAFDYWRRDQVAAACGKFGLRCCSQDDFVPIIAHCWDLRGRPDIAFNLLAQRPDANERRQVEWKICHELEKAGLKLSYAAAICARQFKCRLDDASLKQLWCIFFTIKARVKAKAHAQPQPSI
jgi:hypothetical protein